jgi:hypothetical protein
MSSNGAENHSLAKDDAEKAEWKSAEVRSRDELRPPPSVSKHLVFEPGGENALSGAITAELLLRT